MPDQFLLMPRIINGAIAGVTATIAIYPLDLVKTRLQSQLVKPNQKLRYNSLTLRIIKMYRAEGFLALYRGLAVSAIFGAPEIALKLSGNDFFRNQLRTDSGPLDTYRQMLAGALTGSVTVLVTTPMELLKIQLQNEGRSALRAKAKAESKKQKTAREVAILILKERGICGLYKGIGLCALRDILFDSIYFPGFAYFYDHGPSSPDGEVPSYWSLMSGILSGAVSAFLVTPIDVVKTRLQSLDKAPGDEIYHGVWDCFRKTYHKEGIVAFLRGGFCRVIVIAPLFGITQMVYYFSVAEYILGLQTQKLIR